MRGLSPTSEGLKDGFQDQCEAVFAMLMKKVYRNDLINAMEGYFQVITQDNSVLKTEIERQARELTSQNLNRTILEAAMRDVERSLAAERRSTNKLNLVLSTKNIELGALQMEVESLGADHQAVLDGKDGQLADAEWSRREARELTLQLMNTSRGERERRFIEAKGKQIIALEQTCQELTSSHQFLER